MKEFRKILILAKPYSKRIWFAFLCLLISSLITLLLPLIVQKMVNAALIEKNGDLLNSLTVDLLLVILIQAGFAITQSYIFGFVGQRVTTDFRRNFFSHLQSLSLKFFHERRVGEIVSRMSNDISVIQNALVTIPVAVLRQTITLVGGLTIILYLNWKLTGLILLVLPPLMIFGRVFGKRLRDTSQRLQDRLAQAVVVLEEVASSIRVVKSYNREPYEQKRFQKEIENAFEAAVEKVKIGAFFGPFILALTFLVSTALIWYGGRQVMSGATTPGELAAFFLYAIVIAGPIGTFIRLYTQVQESLGAVRRVFEIFDTEAGIQAPENPLKLSSVKGGIRLQDVVFGYKEETPVLKNVSFEIQPGEVAALVGPSGAGKSTVIQLIHRFFDPEQGAVLLDGHDIRQLDPKQLLEQIAYVPQETVLFGGSIRENILYGKLDASEEEMIQAAKSAHAHEFISELENGYDTSVGEKGVKLSGGQRQRIAIARALLKNPRILILDEATSSLDNHSETLVQEALDSLMANRTTLVIAHRLSTVHNADQIIVLDKGRLIEKGSHQELLNNQKLYYHLYTMKMLDSQTLPEEEYLDDSEIPHTV